MIRLVRTALILFVGIMLIGGCLSSRAAKPDPKPVVVEPVKPKRAFKKSFGHQNWVTYTVDRDALPDMRRLENMLHNVPGIENPKDDMVVYRLYQGADENGDHHITASEAGGYYQDALTSYEGTMQPIDIVAAE